MPFPEHPGQIKMIDLFKGMTESIAINEVAVNRRFVFLKNGVETHNAEEADERVPIVEVRMLSLDKKGNLVDPAVASTVRIDEFGPNNRPLRSTTMRKDK